MAKKQGKPKNSTRKRKSNKKSDKSSKDKFVLLAEVIRKIAGKNTEAILPILFGKKNVNEFFIADKLKLTINQTRNILYKLHALDIVSFTRKKDKRKGWYIYFWTLNELKSLKTLKNIREQEIIAHRYPYLS